MSAKILIFCIRFYQIVISPALGKNCIYTPSCSQYATQALEKYGFWHGSYLSIRRILRCHPFKQGGHDPLP
jgi:putative membrane protein insertion efficiency factor